MANEKGVWRTIGGRRVFIKEGQDLASAMKESGKFKSAKKVSKKDESEESDLDKVKRIQSDLDKKGDKLTKEEKAWKEQLANTQKELESGKSREDIIKDLDREASSNKEQFSVSDLKKKAQATLPKEDIDTHEGDLYLKKTKESTELLNNMKDKDSGLLTTFKDQETGETWYDVPFANMGDDYKEKLKQRQKEIDEWESKQQRNSNASYDSYDKDVRKGEDFIKETLSKNKKSSNDIMNKKIRSRGKSKVEEDDLPKRTEIKTQGTSNRKEVSENIQAHILDYYTEDYTGENISPSEAFVRQMDAMGESNMWRAGQKIAEGGSYLIYNGDMADFLDELKINPKGKTFSEDKAFDMYTSLIGRESAKLYDRIQKNSYKKYMKSHPLSKMSFEEFKDMNKK